MTQELIKEAKIWAEDLTKLQGSGQTWQSLIDLIQRLTEALKEQQQVLYDEELVEEISIAIEAVLRENMNVETHPDNPDWLGINAIITKSILSKAAIKVIKERINGT